MANLKHMNNDMAVSPIVATLVLIVVAVIGAVAVGTIMGTFSSDVSKQANAEGAADVSATEIVIAGSTTVQPGSELIAKAYMAKNPGVKISVQGGGSGAGISAVGNDIVDIGSSSRAVKSSESDQWPDLKSYTLGGSAVVVILNNEGSVTNVTKAELFNLYNNASTTGIVQATIDGNGLLTRDAAGTTYVKVYQRQETSGTEETFAEYLGYSSKSLDGTGATTVIGNQGMFDTITGSSGAGTESSPYVLGFVDYGYWTDGTTSNMDTPSIDSNKVSESNVKSAVKYTLGMTTTTPSYPASLARGLYYITNGNPNSVVKNYVLFAQSPEGSELINEAGMFGNAALA